MPMRFLKSIVLNYYIRVIAGLTRNPLLFFLILILFKMKYTIKEKQEKLNQLKDTQYFDADLQLFQKRFPRHNLNRELARVNPINKERLCGQMIYAMLDAFSAEDILKNRGIEIEKTNPDNENAIFENIEQVNEVLTENGIEVDKCLPAFLETLIGRPIAEVIAEIEAEKQSSETEQTDEGDGIEKTKTPNSETLTDESKNKEVSSENSQDNQSQTVETQNTEIEGNKSEKKK